MAHRKRAIRSELARILGVTPPVVGKFAHDPTFPEFDKKNEAEIYAVCAWWYLRKEANPIPTDEPLLSGDDSDGLERYRQARAGQEEIKLAAARCRVILLDDFGPAVQLVLGEWRRIAEHCKQIGNMDLFDMICEANTNVEQGLEKLYGPADSTSTDSLD